MQRRTRKMGCIACSGSLSSPIQTYLWVPVAVDPLNNHFFVPEIGRGIVVYAET